MSGGNPKIRELLTAVTAEDRQLNIRKTIVLPVDITDQASCQEKVLMLVGATGAGKSTLINGFVNYIYGVQYKNKHRYRLIGDEGQVSQAHSQTKTITAYHFPKYRGQTFSRLPFPLTIVDTPGYGDTEGIERDRKITDQIKEFFSIKGKNGIDHIDGIGFVVQASLSRLTHTQKYIFDSILSIFGKDIANNIFLMVTFADAQQPQVIDAIKEHNIKYKKVFKFNNSALLFNEKNANDDDDHNDNDDDDANDDDDDDDTCREFNEMFWNMGERSFQTFFRVFGKTQPVSLQLTKEVLQERDRLEVLVQGLQQQMRVGLSKIDQVHQEERILKLHEKDIETNKDFNYTVDEIRQRKIDISGQGIHVTNCLNCNMTCHDDCKFADDKDKARCSAMNRDSGDCRICPEHCIWSMHKNNPYKFELFTIKVTKTSQELKKRYEEAKGKKTQKEAIMTGLNQDLTTLHEGVLHNVIKTKECLARLEEIALRPNPLSQIEYIDILIQAEEMEAKEGYLRRMKALQGVREQAVVLSKITDEKTERTFMEKLKTSAGKFWEMLKGTL